MRLLGPSFFLVLAFRCHYIAAGGDARSYLLIRKMALVGQAIMQAPSPMQSPDFDRDSAV
jgi:hypothetical protein